MPNAIKNAGLAFGSVALLFLGLLSTFCCHQLLYAYRKVSGGKPLSYSQVVHLSFQKAGPKGSKYANFIKISVDFFLCLGQIGCCCVFILFMARICKEFFDEVLPEHSLDIRVYETFVFVLLIPYCFVTTLKVLSYFTLIGNVVTLLVLVVIFQYMVQNLQPVEDVNLIAPDFSTIPLFFGSATFSMGVIVAILPIENRMIDRDAFHHWNGLLSLGMMVALVLNIIIGFYGYLTFGQDTVVVLSNMPQTLLYQITNLLYAFVIFITFNMMLYIPIEIIVPPMKRLVKKSFFDKYGEYFIRVGLVTFTYILAISIPCLELMISLFGALAGSFLSFIFPAMAELACQFHSDIKLSQFRIVKCIAVILFGLFGCFVGSFVAIQSMIHDMQQPGGCGA